MLTGPKIAVYVTLACALVALGTFIYLLGGEHQKTAAAKQAASQATRVIRERTNNDREIRALPEKDLCREINGGEPC